MNRCIFAVLVVLGLLGCGLLKSASPRVERLECQARALEPLVDGVTDARQLILDVYTGKASLGATLQALQATEAEVAVLIAALQACEPPVPVPAGEPS